MPSAEGAAQMSAKNSSLRTPLAQVRGLGSAKSGTKHFWHQRLTALANVPLTLFAIGVVLCLMHKDYAGALSVLSNPLVSVGLILFVISATYHMKLGLQVVIEDYIHTEGTKIAALIANLFFATVIGAAAVFAILKISFGG
jgi:succinate dehydrogenase / fumarate reductase membrane anchor subunit